MNEIDLTNKTFEDIKHIDEEGHEFWYARELQESLDYKEWKKFKKVITKAANVCKISNNNVSEHFVDANKVLQVGNKSDRAIEDFKLSRYACYLIIQNADPKLKSVSLCQTYLAIKTRKQELSEKETSELTKREKRVNKRSVPKKINQSLTKSAKNAGVKNFDQFHDVGYKGLYNGETASDIAKRKGLKHKEDILDNMYSNEYITNMFRMTLTEQKLKNENIQTEEEANEAHYKVGKGIRKLLEELDSIMPEDLPTPKKSQKELSRNKALKEN